MHNQETMSSSQIPSPRGAQEQTPDAGHVSGPVPVHPIGGYSWNTDELPGVRRSSSIQSPYGNTPSPSLPSNEFVFVPNTISYGASDIGSSASALTRVMSPNQVSNTCPTRLINISFWVVKVSVQFAIRSLRVQHSVLTVAHMGTLFVSVSNHFRDTLFVAVVSNR